MKKVAIFALIVWMAGAVLAQEGYVFNSRGGVDTVAAARHVIFTDVRTSEYRDYEWSRDSGGDWYNFFAGTYAEQSQVDALVRSILQLQYTEQLMTEPSDLQLNSALPNSSPVLWCVYMSFWKYHTPLESGVLWQACAVQETADTAVINVNDGRLDHFEIYRVPLTDVLGVFTALGV